MFASTVTLITKQGKGICFIIALCESLGDMLTWLIVEKYFNYIRQLEVCNQRKRAKGGMRIYHRGNLLMSGHPWMHWRLWQVFRDGTRPERPAAFLFTSATFKPAHAQEDVPHPITFSIMLPSQNLPEEVWDLCCGNPTKKGQRLRRLSDSRTSGRDSKGQMNAKRCAAVGVFFGLSSLLLLNFVADSSPESVFVCDSRRAENVLKGKQWEAANAERSTRSWIRINNIKAAGCIKISFNRHSDCTSRFKYSSKIKHTSVSTFVNLCERHHRCQKCKGLTVGLTTIGIN